jgi:hypothetical protein
MSLQWRQKLRALVHILFLGVGLLLDWDVNLLAELLRENGNR